MSLTTGASIVGAMFQVGARLGNGFIAANKRAMNSAGENCIASTHADVMVSAAAVPTARD